MYNFVVCFLISFAYSFNLMAVEIGFDVNEDQTININKLRGQSIFTLKGDVNETDISTQLNKSGIEGTINLKPKKVESTTAEITLDISDILNKDIQQDYADKFLPLIDNNKIIIKFHNFKNAEVAEKDDMIKRVNIHAEAKAEIFINNKSTDMEFPVNIIFLKESAFTKKRGEGHILSIRGACKIDLKDFGVKIPDKENSELNLSFNFEGNSK